MLELMSLDHRDLLASKSLVHYGINLCHCVGLIVELFRTVVREAAAIGSEEVVTDLKRIHEIGKVPDLHTTHTR